MEPEKQYRFTPEGMTRIVYGAAMLGGAVLGLGFGHLGDSNYESDKQEQQQEVLDKVFGLQGDLTEAEYNLERHKSDIPEGCRIRLVKYIPGGELAVTNQDGSQITNDSAAVEDLMAHPDQPCGDDTTEIRELVVGLGSKVQAGKDIQEKIDSAQAEADRLGKIVSYGKQWGVGVGAVIGFFAAMSLDPYYKIRNRRHDKYVQRLRQQRQG